MIIIFLFFFLKIPGTSGTFTPTFNEGLQISLNLFIFKIKPGTNTWNTQKYLEQPGTKKIFIDIKSNKDYSSNSGFPSNFPNVILISALFNSNP